MLRFSYSPSTSIKSLPVDRRRASSSLQRKEYGLKQIGNFSRMVLLSLPLQDRSVAAKKAKVNKKICFVISTKR